MSSGVGILIGGATLPGGFAPAADYYPGDSYVDVLAVDIYCDDSALPSRALDVIRRLEDMSPGKPIFLGEFGPAARVDFWQSFPDQIQSLPQLKGIMLWMGRGWDSWENDPLNGSLIDESTSPLIRDKFQRWVDSHGAISLEEWTHPF